MCQKYIGQIYTYEYSSTVGDAAMLRVTDLRTVRDKKGSRALKPPPLNALVERPVEPHLQEQPVAAEP